MTGASGKGQAEIVSRLDLILSNQQVDHDMLITLNECVRGDTGLIERVKTAEGKINGMKSLSIIGDAIVTGLAALGTIIGLRQ